MVSSNATLLSIIRITLTIMIVIVVITPFLILERTPVTSKAVAKRRSRRRFLTYTSSQWELMWLQNVEQWTNERNICDQVLSPEQADFLHKFQVTICTHHFHLEGSDWCAVDDPYNYTRYFYNKGNGTFVQKLPNMSWDTIRSISPQAIVPVDSEDENGVPQVFSRLDFLDETTGEEYSEYIEPLVSHLRHPVAKCEKAVNSQGRLPDNAVTLRLLWVLSRSFVIPLPPISASLFPKKYYFDAGSSTWDAGGGGYSLSYFTTIWKRHGIDFNHIECWEGDSNVTSDYFYKVVPENYKKRTFYHNKFVTKSPDEEGPFVPAIIRETAQKEDYVLFKLDIDNGAVERGNVDFLLSGADDSVQYIDEFVWEHHAGGNYIMRGNWGKTRDNFSLLDSYHYFLRLRHLGVRAHSYV